MKRRRVFRVAAAYAVAAWLVVEVSATVLPVLEAPAWTTRLIVVLALLDFPVAVALAWAFESAGLPVRLSCPSRARNVAVRFGDEHIGLAS